MTKGWLEEINLELEELKKGLDIVETEFVKDQIVNAIEELMWEFVDENSLRDEARDVRRAISKFRYTRKISQVKKSLEKLQKRIDKVIINGVA